jgi:DNA-binding MarR family transcriptional regulator
MERSAAAEPSSGTHRPFRAVGFLLSQLGFQTSKRFAERLAPLELTPRTFALLRHIESDEGRSQHALADALRVPPSRMVALLDELEERGLVKRRPHPSDRRARSLHLTAAGKRLLERAKRVGAEHEREITSDLSATERERLLELLDRIAAGQDLAAGVHPAMGLKGNGPPH